MPTEEYDLVTDLKSTRQTYVNSGSPWNHYGSVSNTTCSSGGTPTEFYHTLVNINVPEKPPNAGTLTGVKLKMYVDAVTTTIGTVTLAARVLNTPYTIGVDLAAGATKPNWGCNWYTSDGTHKWVGTGGAPGSPSGGIDSDYWGGSKDIGEILGISNITGAGWYTFDLTDAVESGQLDWGTNYWVAIVDDVEAAPSNSEFVTFRNYNYGSEEPYVQILFDYSDENLVPEKEDKFLNVEPYEPYPEYVQLTWSIPKDTDTSSGTITKYVVVRHTSDILDDYSTGSVLVRTNEELALDTTTNDGTAYYYRVLICDSYNYIGAGSGSISSLVVGAPRFTNQVSIEKPDVSTFVESGADYSWNVWEEHTVNVTAAAPSLSIISNTAYQYDWYGNGTETGWKTLQTPANSDSVDYAYTKYGAGTVTPKVRIKNNLGYWSSQQSLGSAITLTALDAVAVCKASPMVVDSGDVLRLRADDSDDRNGDGSITKYRFQVQRSSDLKYWDGTAGADPWQVGIHWEDEGTTPFVDVPAIAINHSSATTYTCKSEVTGLSTSAVTSSGVAVTGRTETAVTITSTLSGDTEITAHNSNGSVLTTDATPIDGTPSTAVRIEEGLGMLKGSLEGVCHRASNFHADMAQIWTWKDNKTLLRYYYESVDDTPGSYYIDFKIDDVEERKRDIYWYEWQLKISILNKV